MVVCGRWPSRWCLCLNCPINPTIERFQSGRWTGPAKRKGKAMREPDPPVPVQHQSKRNMEIVDWRTIHRLPFSKGAESRRSSKYINCAACVWRHPPRSNIWFEINEIFGKRTKVRCVGGYFSDGVRMEETGSNPTVWKNRGGLQNSTIPLLTRASPYKCKCPLFVGDGECVGGSHTGRGFR